MAVEFSRPTADSGAWLTPTLAYNGNTGDYGYTTAGTAQHLFTGVPATAKTYSALTIYVDMEWSPNAGNDHATLEYSLDGGGSWIAFFTGVTTAIPRGLRQDSITPSQDLTLVQVRATLTKVGGADSGIFYRIHDMWLSGTYPDPIPVTINDGGVTATLSGLTSDISISHDVNVASVIPMTITPLDVTVALGSKTVYPDSIPINITQYDPTIGTGSSFLAGTASSIFSVNSVSNVAIGATVNADVIPMSLVASQVIVTSDGEQYFDVTISGKNLTDPNVSVMISEQVGRGYDIATIEIALTDEDLLDKAISLRYGTSTFVGFVFATTKISKLTQRLECRSLTARLTEPYSATKTVIDEALTSHDLCALYSQISGVPISITSSNLDFGGSYSRQGTILSALSNITNVTGGEFWDDNGTLRIEPNKAISDADIASAKTIDESDIFDFVVLADSVYNKGIGYVIIQNGGDENTDIIAKNNVYAEVDECSGETHFYPSPFGQMEHTIGVSSLSSVIVDRKDNISVLDTNVVVLDGAIESVDKVTLNGNLITNYDFTVGFNMMYFTTQIRGTLEVSYRAQALRGYPSVSQTPIGRFITFDVYYLDQVLQFQGFLSEDCVDGISTDGDMSCIINDTNYIVGFDFWTIAGDPEFTFYQNSVKITKSVISTPDNYLAVERASLQSMDDGSYRYQTRFPITSALGARSGSDDIPYATLTEDGDDYFTFPNYYPNISVSYEVAATKHYVQFPEIPNSTISMVIRNLNSDEICEYTLNGAVPCALNQFVPIDIANELNVTLTAIAGSNLTWIRPDSISGNATIDSFGILKVWVDIDGDYVVDTSALKARTEITLTSQVGG